MDLLQQHWSWIASNPVGFIAMAALFSGLGWTAAKLIYGERIEVLRTRVERTQEHASPVKGQPAAFTYPPHGRHGRNILSNSTHQVHVNEPLSLHAVIPTPERLHIVLSGLPPIYISDTSAAWGFSVVGVVNWVQSLYHQDMKAAQQHFDAEAGPADLQLSFSRTGDLVIQAFEGGSQSLSWTRRIRVVEQASLSGA